MGDGGGNTPGRNLDECFAGFPGPVSFAKQMVATKASADGKVRFRIALDTKDFVGTSGTFPWSLVRFAIEAEGSTVCLTAAAALSTAYKGTHHNCMDTASITGADGVRYEIKAPDRTTATISAFRGATMLWGPVMVSDTMCVMKTATMTFPQCQSGGPC